MNKYWQLILAILFALAAAFGLAGHRVDVKNLFGSKTTVSHLAAAADGSLEDFYQTAQSLAPQSPGAQSVSFLAAGDIMLSRNVAAGIKQANDVSLPFLGMADILKSMDFNFANLESPVAPGQAIVGGHTMVFAAPDQNIPALKTFNFQILNLANNHAFDQGLAGLDATKKALNDLGLAHEGTGDNLDEAWTPAIVTSNGMKICFIGASYASVNDGGKTTNTYVARMEDLPRLKTAITTALAECDFVVATMHGGIEYTRTPDDLQIKFAHAAIDDGADVVIGAHPHWIQTIEQYQGKYIFYSLGNFIFDQNFSQDTMEGLTLKITLSKSTISNPQAPNAASLSDLQGARSPAQLESIELLPVIITNSQPRPATADETKKILQKIGETENILK